MNSPKKKIRVAFGGVYWDNVTPFKHPYVYELLQQRFDVELCDNPDYLLLKEGPEFHDPLLLRFPGAKIRVFSAREALAPDFNLYDYCVGFDPIKAGDRYLQWNIPQLFRGFIPMQIENLGAVRPVRAYPKRFCNFIYSNAGANPLRDEFFRNLNAEYKTVDSLGKHLNNTNWQEDPMLDWIGNKLRILGEYKFTIAFENASSSGYTTEKLLHPLVAGSIPVYWGNPDVATIFNPKAFINCHDYDGFQGVIEKIKLLDADNGAFQLMLSEPILTDQQMKDCIDFPIREQEFLFNIFEQPIAEARRRADGFWNNNYERMLQERALRANRSQTFVQRVSSKLERFKKS